MRPRPLAICVVLVIAAFAGGGCSALKSDETLARERLKQFDRAWREYDAAGVRMAMASETPQERELADGFAELAASKKQLANAERHALERLEKSIPYPLRRFAGPKALGLKPGMLTISRWDALAKEAGSPGEVTMLEDGHAAVATASNQVTFNLRKQPGNNRWVIDPQTFGPRGAAAAALRQEALGNTEIAAALDSRSIDQLIDVLPREAARRAADMAFADDTGATAGLIERILGLPPAAPPAAPAAAHD
jgi:hypothetical protein